MSTRKTIGCAVFLAMLALAPAISLAQTSPGSYQVTTPSIRPSDFALGAKAGSAVGASKTEVKAVADSIDSYAVTNNAELTTIENNIVAEGNSLLDLDGRLSVEERKAYNTTVTGTCFNCFNGLTSMTQTVTVYSTLATETVHQSCAEKYGYLAGGNGVVYSGDVIRTRTYSVTGGTRVPGSESDWVDASDTCVSTVTETRMETCSSQPGGTITQSQTTTRVLAGSSPGVSSSWSPACVEQTSNPIVTHNYTTENVVTQQPCPNAPADTGIRTFVRVLTKDGSVTIADSGLILTGSTCIQGQ